MKRLIASALCTIVLAAPSRLLAQTSNSAGQSGGADQLTDLALEDLLKVKVYAASKFVQDVGQAPASVSVITADEIRSHGYRTLADVLRNVRGFYVSYDRDYSYVGVRGFSRPGDYNSRVLLLVNGHRLNDAVFESALIGTESPLDVALIERVEVIRGPSSSLYGASAFFAVVNIITRAGRSLAGMEIEGESGSQALRNGRFTMGGRSAGGIEGLFSVSAFNSSGSHRLYFPEFDVPGVGTGIVTDADDDRSVQVFGSASGRGLNLQGAFGSRTKTIPTGAFDTIVGDPRTETRDARSFIDLQYTRRLESRSTLQVRASYDVYAYDGTYAYDSGLMEDGARGNWIAGELSVVRQFDHHGLTAGAEYRGNLRQDQSVRDETGVRLNDRRRSEVMAVYAEDELRIRAGVLLNAGVRWDHYFETFGSTLNPRLGLIVTPFEGGSLKLLYGRAFRAPNPFELYYDQNALSATLKPERIATYEAAWEQRISSGVRITGSVFRYDVSDLISQHGGSDTIDGLYYQNGDAARAAGAEFEMQMDLPARVQGRVSHTFQFVHDAQTGTVLSNSPEHLGNVVLDAPIGRSGFRLGFDAYRLGSRRTVSGDVVPQALVTGFTLSRPAPDRGLGFALSVRNALDATYGDPGSIEHRQQSIPQDGRTLSARATWRF